MLPSLDYKPNLYDIDDMEIEEFRDFLTDMFYGDKSSWKKDILNILDMKMS